MRGVIASCRIEDKIRTMLNMHSFHSCSYARQKEDIDRISVISALFLIVLLVEHIEPHAA